ncbi:hypothetical protein [Sutterella sp.]|uniref:hypothetical protein n=1 Tax=Sutterella sp. TaxID=1981025 RepID=UPI0026E110BB|nr:hypothetical protein [Sutterella sp.]MDO5532067.1 hypothetical protein [Sutterella sp.]
MIDLKSLRHLLSGGVAVESLQAEAARLRIAVVSRLSEPRYRISPSRGSGLRIAGASQLNDLWHPVSIIRRAECRKQRPRGIRTQKKENLRKPACGHGGFFFARPGLQEKPDQRRHFRPLGFLPDT